MSEFRTIPAGANFCYGLGGVEAEFDEIGELRPNWYGWFEGPVIEDRHASWASVSKSQSQKRGKTKFYVPHRAIVEGCPIVDPLPPSVTEEAILEQIRNSFRWI